MSRKMTTGIIEYQFCSDNKAIPLGLQCCWPSKNILGFGTDINIKYKLGYNISNGQLSDVTGSAHVMDRYLANAIVSDKVKEVVKSL